MSPDTLLADPSAIRLEKVVPDESSLELVVRATGLYCHHQIRGRALCAPYLLRSHDAEIMDLLDSAFSVAKSGWNPV
jgi:hypothetical protein